MAGNKKISELPLVTVIEASSYLPVVDPTEVSTSDQNKRITISQLDLRYVTVTGFDAFFDARLGTKTSDNITEGAVNQYYTETKVSNNADVLANTADRHKALSLSADTVGVELDTLNQELRIPEASHTESGLISKEMFVHFDSKQEHLMAASSLRYGFLSQEDWIYFDNKVSKSIADTDEVEVIADQNKSFENIIGLVFDPTIVLSFNVYVSIEIVAGSEQFRTFNLRGQRQAGNMVIMTPAEQDAVAFGGLSDFHFFINAISGQVSYSSGNYPGLSSARIKYRASSIGA